MKGIMNFHYGDTESDGTTGNFEFELTIGNQWLPLVNEKVQDKHWSQFPDDTKVGWRGPAMKWSDLCKLPSVRYTEEEF